MRAWPALPAALLLLSAAPSVAAPLPPSAFSYAASAPLDIRGGAAKTKDGVSIRDITFASPVRGRVTAEIIGPAKSVKSGPGVLFVHWLGDPPTTNLTEFIPDATALAKAGAVCVLIDAQWAQPGWFDTGRKPATDYADSIRQVVDLRRSLDVLLAQPGVDAHRIAYVGHDFGSMYGAVLSGVDPRPQWYVLMAGTTSFSDWFLLGVKPKNTAAYVAQIKVFAPTDYLARSSARAFFFQFSDKDPYVPASAARAFAAAVGTKGETRFYHAGHDLKGAGIERDRLQWLETHLEI